MPIKNKAARMDNKHLRCERTERPADWTKSSKGTLSKHAEMQGSQPVPVHAGSARPRRTSFLMEAGMSDWQPIETAPMDGTPVDLWCRRSWNPPETHERRTGVYYCRTHRCWRTVGVGHYVESTFTFDGRWNDRFLIPTHWMPIPPPPATDFEPAALR